MISQPLHHKSSLPSRRKDTNRLPRRSCRAVVYRFVHFTLTFIPYVSGLGMGQHYSYEEWGRRLATPYILEHIWIEPFFTTSARFLHRNISQGGPIVQDCKQDVTPGSAHAHPRRNHRDAGVLSDRSGSHGRVAVPPLEILIHLAIRHQLSQFRILHKFHDRAGFLIPNAAPQVAIHYCIDVLWTILVQLQNSYLVSLGVVMIKDVKTPWKRLAFYTFCVVNHWYVYFWGTLFWLGLVLADLDITYKCFKWLQARRLVHYPFLMLMCIIAIAASTFHLVQDQLGYPLISVERGWHPDHETGLPLAQMPRAGYPN